ncbi:DUF2339 domain-containing protein [Heyndrickxia acidiproducens]|uniref:DUF2339 domain-containing protein n=1 Tax=Heyndrickxia acidiproducens TaxID=1121084 RepID=UPI000369D395|nr:DUF2339 domain-containing protein [Heyndrickxia acidiproducens]
MEHDRIKRLELRIEALEKEVQALKDDRLNQENRYKKPEPVLSKKTENQTVSQPKQPEQPKQSEQPKQQQIPEPPARQHVPVDWEYRIGRVWLPRIFIFVLLLGLIFAFTIVAIAGTDLIRILMGYGLAGLLAWLGERQVKKQRDALGKVLLSGSISVAILTTFAMHALYGMVPPAAAFILNIIWVLLGIYLAKRHRSEAIAILTACAGYLIPFLVEGREHAANFVIWYETVFYALLLLFAVKQGYRNLLYAASGLWHAAVFLLYIALLGSGAADGAAYSIVLGALAQHVLLCYFSFYRKEFEQVVLPMMFTSFTLTTIWAYICWGVPIPPFHDHQADLKHTLFNVYLLAVAAVYGWFAYNGWKKQIKDQLAVAVSISTVSFSFLLYQILPHGVLILAVYLIAGLFAIYLGCLFRVAVQQVIGYIIFIPAVLFTLTIVRIRDILSPETAVWLVFIGTFYAFYQLTSAYYEQQTGFRNFLIGANAFIHLMFITQAANALTGGWSVSLRMMVQSFAWMIYAVSGIVIGVLKDKKSFRFAGMILLMITLCKLVFVDLYTVNLLVRTILFIGLGATGLLVSRLFYVKK